MGKGRVVLAMSGGVDSSVSACLLADEGYDVVGLFMRTGAHDDAPATSNKIRGCCSAIDAADARRVADRLGIPFYSLNFSEEFGRIKDYFADEYLRGRTPNPCVVCNTWLKFGKLWEYAESVDAEFIATGHYAQILPDAAGRPGLFRGADLTKDQSYFLFGIRPDLLPRILMPVGHLQKERVRQLATEYRLPLAQKPDSQEICFVPSGNYQDFLQKHRPNRQESAGDVVDPAGNKLGQHAGLSHYTIGQRKGLGLAFGEPRYVVELKTETNQVVIGPRELLAQDRLEAERVNWLIEPEPSESIRADVKIRYLHQPAAANIRPRDQGEIEIAFDTPQQAVTPGQAVVFYRNAQVLGGAWIK
jgi:tRNA-uridine 2-sulfurtransferase